MGDACFLRYFVSGKISISVDFQRRKMENMLGIGCNRII